MDRYYIYEFDEEGRLDSVRSATQEEIDTLDWGSIQYPIKFINKQGTDHGTSRC